MKKIVLIVAIISAILCLTAYFNIKSPQKVEIVRVLDGDTIETTSSKIRLAGIDCYETQNRQRSYKQAYENSLTIEQVIEKGKKQTEILTNILNEYKGKIYFTEKAGNPPDKYNRQLGTLYAGKINVNEYMLQQGGCLKYNYTQTASQEEPTKPSLMSFIIWFGIFAVLAWYQQRHRDSFNGSSENFYTILCVYCILNLIFSLYLIYLGFAVMKWWFIPTLILAPIVVQAIFLLGITFFSDKYVPQKISILGIALIPISIFFLLGGVWYILYISAAGIYVFLVLQNTKRNR